MDAKNVFEALHFYQKSLGPFDHLIDDAKMLLRFLQCSSLCNVGRKVNEIAHRLARFAKGLSEPMYWMEDGPPCIESTAVLNDLTVFPLLNL